jgi:Tetratricopeptide repeat
VFKPRSAAEAFAALGELCRRRGDYQGAEDAFRRAHELGGDPQPGLALVRLAQGHAAAASTALGGALSDRSTPPMRRAQLLAAQVEVALTATSPSRGLQPASCARSPTCSIARRRTPERS